VLQNISATEIFFSLFHLGVYQTCDEAENDCVYIKTLLVSTWTPSILDGLYTVEIHVKVLIFLRHTLGLDAEVIKTEIMESNHVSKNHEMYKLFCLIWIRSFTSKAKTFD
jgi:hypothetical protein